MLMYYSQKNEKAIISDQFNNQVYYVINVNKIVDNKHPYSEYSLNILT